MKKRNLFIGINLFSIFLFVAVIPLFVLWLVFVDDYRESAEIASNVFLCLWVPLLIVSFVLFTISFKEVKSVIQKRIEFLQDCVKIKSLKGRVLINTNLKVLKYRRVLVELQDIVEFQLVNNQTIVDKSGIGESIVGGMLFGGTGAIAGAMVGKKQKVKDGYKVFIKTVDVKNAGIVIALKIDQAYRLFETLKLVTKNTDNN